MNKQYRTRVPVLLAVIAASATWAGSQDAVGEPTGQSHSQRTVDGVWRVTRHGVNCVTGGEVSTFPALMTFHADGTVSGQAVPPGSTNAFGPGEHGVWKRGPGGAFSFKFLSYGYDDSGIFSGSTEIAGTGHVMNGNTFAYKASIEFFDVSGNLLFKACGAATAVRFE